MPVFCSLAKKLADGGPREECPTQKFGEGEALELFAGKVGSNRCPGGVVGLVPTIFTLCIIFVL
jgi:hypothetical protein